MDSCCLGTFSALLGPLTMASSFCALRKVGLSLCQSWPCVRVAIRHRDIVLNLPYVVALWGLVSKGRRVGKMGEGFRTLIRV